MLEAVGEDLVGSTIGNYVIESFIASGGYASVWRANHFLMDRQVALKVLHPEEVLLRNGINDPAAQRRFIREAKVQAKLNHPNILEIYDCGHSDGVPYIAMRLVEGKDLYGLGKLAPDVALPILKQAAEGLDKAHSHGIIHRDVKPRNVLVDNRQKPPTVFISDFGIAAIEQDGTKYTAAGVRIGTHAFMSPEMFLGNPLTTRSDVYSFGCLVFTVLTGEEPFRGEIAGAFMHQATNEASRPLPSEHDKGLREFDGAVKRAMAVKPEDRYETCSDLVKDLEASLATDPRLRRKKPWMRAGRNRLAGSDPETTVPDGPSTVQDGFEQCQAAKGDEAFRLPQRPSRGEDLAYSVKLLLGEVSGILDAEAAKEYSYFEFNADGESSYRMKRGIEANDYRDAKVARLRDMICAIKPMADNEIGRPASARKPATSLRFAHRELRVLMRSITTNSDGIADDSVARDRLGPIEKCLERIVQNAKRKYFRDGGTDYLRASSIAFALFALLFAGLALALSSEYFQDDTLGRVDFALGGAAILTLGSVLGAIAWYGIRRHRDSPGYFGIVRHSANEVSLAAELTMPGIIGVVVVALFINGTSSLSLDRWAVVVGVAVGACSIYRASLCFRMASKARHRQVRSRAIRNGILLVVLSIAAGASAYLLSQSLPTTLA